MCRFEVTLPGLGLEGHTVVVSLWLVSAGSRVSEGQQLVEVRAAEALIDLPSPASGTVVETLVAEDEQVQVGQTLAVIESDDCEPFS